MREHPTRGHSTREPGSACADVHQECHLLLPWLVNGTLSERERQGLEAHLAICDSCRAEMAEQAVLRHHVLRDDAVVYAPQASLQKLLNRIDASPPEQRVQASTSASGFAVSQRWRVAAVLLSAIAVVFTVSRSGWRVPDDRQDDRMQPRYSTLTSEPSELSRTPAARVVFAPTTSVARLSELLHRHRARVVAGPTEAGVYTLTFMPSDDQAPARADGAVRSSGETPMSRVESSIDALRREPDVLFVEPVLTGSSAR